MAAVIPHIDTTSEGGETAPKTVSLGKEKPIFPRGLHDAPRLAV